MKYQCLIVDDEPIAHRILQNYLSDHVRIATCHHAAHAHAARAVYTQYPIDLLFLDIQMPEETGLQFLRTLPAPSPITIFTTAFTDYMLEGFELGVIDYLVKPIRRERFEIALNRAIEFLDLRQLQSTLQASTPSQNNINIQSGAKHIQLPVAAITHIQGLKDYAIIHTTDRRHVVRMTMKDVELLMAPYHFVRVHKSFIVAPDKLDLRYRNKIEFNDFQIPVGRKYQKVLKL